MSKLLDYITFNTKNDDGTRKIAAQFLHNVNHQRVKERNKANTKKSNLFTYYSRISVFVSICATTAQIVVHTLIKFSNVWL